MSLLPFVSCGFPSLVFEMPPLGVLSPSVGCAAFSWAGPVGPVFFVGLVFFRGSPCFRFSLGGVVLRKQKIKEWWQLW